MRTGRELGFAVTVLTHPEGRDPQAASYCPLCFDDFRDGYSRCESCGLSTMPYGAALAGS